MATRGTTQPNRANARAANAGRRKRRRRGKRTLHYLLLLVFLLVVGAVLSMTVLFKIERVDVVGVDRYTPDEVAAVSGVLEGDNLLRINKREIEENILTRFPYIDSVQVRRRIPTSVEIAVTQAQPVGAISLEDEVLLIDRAGKVLERGLVMVPEGTPLVKGIDASGVMPGETLGAYTPPVKKKGEELTEAEKAEQARAEETQEKLLMLRYLLEAMEASGFENLTNVDLSDRLNIRIMYEGRITLELGSEMQLEYKLALVKSVLENNIGPDEVGTLDATDAARSRVVFSPAPVQGERQQEVVIETEGAEEPPEEENTASG